MSIGLRRGQVEGHGPAPMRMMGELEEALVGKSKEIVGGVFAAVFGGLFGALVPMPRTFYDHPGTGWVPRRVGECAGHCAGAGGGAGGWGVHAMAGGVMGRKG